MRLPAVVLALSIAARGLAAPAEIWVAPNGSDAATGTREQPLASPALALRHARDLRRQHAPAVADGITIRLRGGRYELGEPVVIRAEDSGTAASPTLITAVDGESVVWSGGRRVTGWAKAAAFPGMPAGAAEHVWSAVAPEVGGQPLPVRELWVNGHRAVRARTPNPPELSQLAAWDRPGQIATVPRASLGGVLRPDGVEMVVEQQWEIAILRLRTIQVVGEQARLTFQQPESALEFEHPWPQPILPPHGGGAFYLVNAPEFLDTAGEWYQDRASGRIWYWPRAGEDLSAAEVVVPAAGTLLQVAGSLDQPVEHVAIRGVEFAYTAWLDPERTGHVPHQAGMPMTEAYRLSPKGTPYAKALDNVAWIERIPAAVTVRAATGVAFTRCQFQHTSASALDIGEAVRDSVIEGCGFRDIGGNGIQLGSFGEHGEIHRPYAPADDRVVTAGLRIANNVFRDTANVDWGCLPIIAAFAHDVTIEHNDIADTSYTGISVGWGWTPHPNVLRNNRVHANRIQHFATRVCDTAGIYTQSAQPGTVVSENVVDDAAINRYVDRPDHWFYLYTDEGSSGIVVRDNWCPTEKFLQNNNGPGNTWTNNGPKVSDAIKSRAGLEPAWK